MLHDLFTIGINGKTSGGLNTSASNCMCIALEHGTGLTKQMMLADYANPNGLCVKIVPRSRY